MKVKPSMVAVALVAGLMLFGLSALETRSPTGSSTGLPLSYSALIASCRAPNALNGCGFSYNVGIVALDYLFWAALAFAFAFIIDRRRTADTDVTQVQSPET
jgi:hypothetical protein